MPKSYGVTPAGRIARRTQQAYEPIGEGYVRVEGRLEDPPLRARPPKRKIAYRGVAYDSIREAARALGCSQRYLKRAIRNGTQRIRGKCFTVWEKRS